MRRDWHCLWVLSLAACVELGATDYREDEGLAGDGLDTPQVDVEEDCCEDDLQQIVCKDYKWEENTFPVKVKVFVATAGARTPPEFAGNAAVKIVPLRIDVEIANPDVGSVKLAKDEPGNLVGVVEGTLTARRVVGEKNTVVVWAQATDTRGNLWKGYEGWGLDFLKDGQPEPIELTVTLKLSPPDTNIVEIKVSPEEADPTGALTDRIGLMMGQEVNGDRNNVIAFRDVRETVLKIGVSAPGYNPATVTFVNTLKRKPEGGGFEKKTVDVTLTKTKPCPLNADVQAP